MYRKQKRVEKYYIQLDSAPPRQIYHRGPQHSFKSEVQVRPHNIKKYTDQNVQ